MKKISATVKYAAFLIITFLWAGFPRVSSAQDNTTYDLLTPLPLGEGGTVEESVTTTGVGFSEFINDMIVVAIALAAGLAVVMIVIGGIKYITSESAGGKQSGKEYVTNAIGGLLLALGSFIILNTINPELVQVRGVEQIDVQIYDTPTDPPGWYYQNIDGSWAGSFGTDIDAKRECEIEGEKALKVDDDDEDNKDTDVCIEVAGSQSERTYCWYQDEIVFDLQRCLNSISRCLASQGTGKIDTDEYKLRSDVVVECREYHNPDDERVCIDYDPLGVGSSKTACYASTQACQEAERYIRDKKRTVHGDGCYVDQGKEGNNDAAQYCVVEQTIPRMGPGQQPVTTTVCKSEWNGDIEACRDYAKEREETGQIIIIDRCYTNSDFTKNFPDNRDQIASQYRECFSVTIGGEEKFACAPGREDCNAIRTSFSAVIGKNMPHCSTETYSAGDYSSRLVIEPCVGCQPLSRSIPIKNNNWVESGFKTKFEVFASDFAQILEENTYVTFEGHNWYVTEAWPPTTFHQSRCHRKGDCVDINYSGDINKSPSENRETEGTALYLLENVLGPVTPAAKLIRDTMKAAEDAGLCLVYEYNAKVQWQDDRFRALRATMNNIADDNNDEEMRKFARRVVHIPVGAPHFSVYNSPDHGNCTKYD